MGSVNCTGRNKDPDRDILEGPADKLLEEDVTADKSNTLLEVVPPDGEGIQFEQYIFPFENVVFEGGGNKCLGYCGSVRVSRP